MSYQTEEIFADARLNAIADHIIARATTSMAVLNPGLDVPSSIVLSGRAAAIMQGAAAAEINNVVFQVQSELLFSWLVKNLPREFGCKSIGFKERLLAYPLDYFVEVWYSPGEAVKPVAVHGITMQQIEFIPEETL